MGLRFFPNAIWYMIIKATTEGQECSGCENRKCLGDVLKVILLLYFQLPLDLPSRPVGWIELVWGHWPRKNSFKDSLLYVCICSLLQATENYFCTVKLGETVLRVSNVFVCRLTYQLALIVWVFWIVTLCSEVILLHLACCVHVCVFVLWQRISREAARLSFHLTLVSVYNSTHDICRTIEPSSLSERLANWLDECFSLL